MVPDRVLTRGPGFEGIRQMNDRDAAPDSSGNERGDEASPDDEAALIRNVLRMQERHREGGIDPELRGDDDQTETDAPG